MKKIFAFIILFLIAGQARPAWALRNPLGDWRDSGFELTFSGRCMDSIAMQPVKVFQVRMNLHGTPKDWQEIHTTDGNFRLRTETNTQNGQSHFRGFRTVRVFGPSKESVELEVKAEGYRDAKILIPKDQILVGPENHITIQLIPEGKG